MTDQGSRPAASHDGERDANVHPRNWINPTPDRPYHLLVVGAGTAGLVTAAGAAGLGARVALVERDLMGGDCLNVGCVPSKSLIASARMAAAVNTADAFSVRLAGGGEVDFAGVMRRMRQLRARISRHDSAARFRDLGVDVYFGNAQFIGSDSVDVEGTRLRFKRAVIATGSRPAVPPIEGLDGIDYLTNESIFSLTELPRRLGIIGAGPIGVEMAQTFARFGAQVHLVESGHGILSKDDRDGAQIVRQAIERDGVNVLCCGKRLQLKTDDGIRLVVDSHGKAYDRPVDQILLATGRTANVEGLNLEAVGVDHDRGGIRVDDHLRTTNPRIFAAGDVCSQYKFTHAADFMARIVIQNALFAVGPLGKKRFSDLLIPWATYTSPELAQVGVREQDAKMQIDTYVQQFSELDRAVLEGDEDGLLKIHTKKGTDSIVGAMIVAPHAGDLISQITQAMVHRIGLGQIAGVIHPYPTQAEAIRKLGDQYNRTRLTPRSTTLLGLLRRFNVGN